MKSIPLLLVVALALAGSPEASAFTEMIRHGYVNCTSCHVNPAGGGALTEYGRQLSGEVMSTWSRENEGNFAYSAFALPKWLNVGGDVRGAQAFRDTPQVKAARYIFMQADGEVAATVGNWTADVSAGAYMSQFESRRHYLMMRPTEEWSLRAGKFQTAFGILNPDHLSVTRRGIGWDEGSETYNLEASWLGPSFSGYVTADFGRPDDSSLNREKGLALRPAISFADRYQIGLSYFYGVQSDVATRHLGGPFAALGFTPRMFLLTELDFQSKTLSGASEAQVGFVNSQRLDYEPMQGLHFFVIQEASRLDFKDSATQFFSMGLGSQFFPRPHFEFTALWQKQKSSAFPQDFTDYVTLLGHFYL